MPLFLFGIAVTISTLHAVRVIKCIEDITATGRAITRAGHFIGFATLLRPPIYIIAE